jgi:hypothetical protein
VAKEVERDTELGLEDRSSKAKRRGISTVRSEYWRFNWNEE